INSCYGGPHAGFSSKNRLTAYYSRYTTGIICHLPALSPCEGVNCPSGSAGPPCRHHLISACPSCRVGDFHLAARQFTFFASTYPCRDIPVRHPSCNAFVQKGECSENRRI